MIGEANELSPEKENNLSPEVAESIMAKVQDINAQGTAFSVISKEAYNIEQKELEKVFDLGLLGNEYKHRTKSVDKKDWAKNTRNKDAVVYFNIMGRSEETQLQDTFYFGDQEVISMIFDLSPFEEQKTERKDGKLVQKNRTYRSDQGRRLMGSDDSSGEVETAYGFTLSFRVPPRLFRGIVMKVAHHHTEQEATEFVENKRAFLLKRNRPYTPEEEVSDREAFFNERVIPGNAEDYQNQAEKIAESMKERYKDREELIVPIYDVSGNLLWPEQIPYDRVKKLVAERDKKE